MTLDEARECIGAMVTYKPPGMGQQFAEVNRLIEYGIVRSVNDTYVFVQYEGDSGSKATAPDLLTLVVR